MTGFLALTALMVAVALAVLILPLLRAGRTSLSAPAWIAVLVLVPLFAGGGYYWTSNWIWNDEDREVAAREEMYELLQQTQAQFEITADPNNWFQLGATYFQQEFYAEAAYAFSRASALFGPTVIEPILAHAQSLLLADPEALSDVLVLLERVLSVDPNYRRALMLGGLIAFETGDYVKAQTYWQRQMLSETDPDTRSFLQGQLAQLPALIRDMPASASPSPTPPISTGIDPLPATNPAAVEIEVVLADSLRDQIPAGAVLFLYARADGATAGAPLAARNLSPADLPGTFRLGAENNPMGQPFTWVNSLTVTAHISRSGTAGMQAGDFYGELVLTAGQDDGRIVIDRVVQ